jgi:acyl-CoA thioester hydrolase
MFSLPIQHIRFGEFDLGGVLYHANYFHIYEQVREEFLLEGPLSYQALLSDGCHLAVVESAQKFIKPIRYGEQFTVNLTVERLKRASFDLCYAFVREEELLHTASTSMVFVKVINGALKVSPLPRELHIYLGQQ